MAKAVSLKFLKLEYGGDSVGNNIRIEIKVADKFFTIDQDIKVRETFEFNQEVAQLQIDNDILEIPVHIKVTEKDIIFNDVGEISGTLNINTATFPQTFNFQIKVQEIGTNFRKSTAIFTITLLADFSHSNLLQYKSPKSGQNYNQYDVFIEAAVTRWNREFLNQAEPPSVPLDPNLAKAMIYVESKMGYGASISYPSYPDIMQVGDPRNGSLYVLKNIPNPKSGKKKTEYEIIDGKEVRIEYPEANVDTPEASILWGVRWFFRKARENHRRTDGTWYRQWSSSWEEALPKYNVGDKKYTEKVMGVYKHGLGERKFRLWLASLLLIPPLSLMGWLHFNQNRVLLSFEDVSEPMGMGYKVKAKIIDGLWFQDALVADVHAFGGSMYGINKDEEIKIRYIDIDHDGKNEITITGTYFPENTTKYIFKKYGDEFRLIHNIDQWGSEREVFSGQEVSLEDEDKDGILEAREDSYLGYINAPVQIWTNYYRFDGQQYKFYKQDKVNFENYSRSFGCHSYCENKNEKEFHANI